MYSNSKSFAPISYGARLVVPGTRFREKRKDCGYCEVALGVHVRLCLFERVSSVES